MRAPSSGSVPRASGRGYTAPYAELATALDPRAGGPGPPRVRRAVCTARARERAAAPGGAARRGVRLARGRAAGRSRRRARALALRPLRKREHAAGRPLPDRELPRAPPRPGGDRAPRLLRAERRQRGRDAAGPDAGAAGRGRAGRRRGLVRGRGGALLLAPRGRHQRDPPAGASRLAAAGGGLAPAPRSGAAARGSRAGPPGRARPGILHRGRLVQPRTGPAPPVRSTGAASARGGMSSAAWRAFYDSEIQGFWALLVLPTLWLVARAARGRPRALGVEPGGAAFVDARGLVF